MTARAFQLVADAALPAVLPNILAHAANSDINVTTLTTTATDTTGATALVAWVRLGNAHSATLTDSAGNTWVHDGPIGSAGYKFLDVWHCVNPITSSSHTITATYDASMTNGTELYLIAVGNVGALDDKTATHSATNVAQPWEVSLTTTAARGIIIAGCALLATHYRTAINDSAGWTALDSPERPDHSGNRTSATAYQVTATAAPFTSSWTTTGATSDYYGLFLIAFE